MKHTPSLEKLSAVLVAVAHKTRLRASVLIAVAVGMSLACMGCGSSSSTTTGCGASCPAKAEFLYSYSYGNSALVTIPVDLSTGALGSPATSGGPHSSWSVVAAPSGKFLYVSDTPMDAVDGFSVNSTSGALTPLPGSPFSLGNPSGSATGGLAIEPGGKFLYATDTNATNVVGFSINSSTGSLTPLTGSHAMTGSGPLGEVVDPQGKFLFVANSGDATLSSFAINSSNGALTPVPGSPFSTFPGDGPQFLAVHPSGKYLYTDLPGPQGGMNFLGAYAIGANGALTPVSGSPYALGNFPLGVAVDPAGKVVYAANDGDGTISAFTVDSNSGALAEISGSPFSAGVGGGGLARCPYDLRVHPGGKVLYSGDGCGPDMLSFSIDSAGALGTPVVTNTPAFVDPLYLAFVTVK